jgi:hypothetical protein
VYILRLSDFRVNLIESIFVPAIFWMRIGLMRHEYYGLEISPGQQTQKDFNCEISIKQPVQQFLLYYLKPLLVHSSL